ncbi:MAG: hypothetical protein ACMZ64_04015 [Oleiphilus sp.]
MKNITGKLNQSVTHIPSTIKEAQTPAFQLWLIITPVGLSLLAIALFVVSAYCMKQVGKLGTTSKEIADNYRIMPAEQYRKEYLKELDSRTVDKDSVE